MDNWLAADARRTIEIEAMEGGGFVAVALAPQTLRAVGSMNTLAASGMGATIATALDALAAAMEGRDDQ